MRRSRGGFSWADGRDAPLDTPDERYTVRLSAEGLSTGAVQQNVTVTAAELALSAAEVAVLAGQRFGNGGGGADGADRAAWPAR